ncbi:hypothetical protein [Streptomyces sp. NPDC002599]|uniref:hypothetical protein n=1 Tax=Streptomyces sp. NPDC002599 TaxID=3154421 RepID=UPI00331E9C6A
MSEGSKARAADRPIPRDRPDQQAAKNDPLDIETMLRHARQAAGGREPVDDRLIKVHIGAGGAPAGKPGHCACKRPGERSCEAARGCIGGVFRAANAISVASNPRRHHSSRATRGSGGEGVVRPGSAELR